MALTDDPRLAQPQKSTLYTMPSTKMADRRNSPRSGPFGLPIVEMLPGNPMVDNDDLAKYYYDQYYKDRGQVRPFMRALPKDDEVKNFNDWLIDKYGYKYNEGVIQKLPNARKLVNENFDFGKPQKPESVPYSPDYEVSLVDIEYEGKAEEGQQKRQDPITAPAGNKAEVIGFTVQDAQIGRASCRERV